MGGGGGDGGSSAMMMALVMQQMQQQAEAQRQQIAADNLKRTQGYEKTNAGRYQTLVDEQNKKMSGLYDQYNTNIDEILKVDPTYTANTKKTWTPYTVDSSIDFTYDDANPAGASQDTVDGNISKIDDFYGKLDKQSFDDYTNFKKTVDQSGTWLNAANQKKDILGRNMPGVAVTPWGGGGGMVSGGAGADSLKPAAGMGLVTDADPNAKTGLADVFSGAVSGSSPSNNASSGKSIF
jgi:hypothetical protein